MSLHRQIGVWLCMGVVGCLAACSSKYKDISGDPVSPESVQNAIQGSHAKSMDILDEVRSAVKALFGNSFDHEVTLVHVPMTLLNTVQFEKEGALYRSRKEGHDLGSAFLSYVDSKSGQIFVDPHAPPYRVLILTEDLPYADDASYYLSKTDNGQSYFYVVGVDVESAKRLGISMEGVKLPNPDSGIHSIVLLKKDRAGVTNTEP